jgi:hypothetical protein
MVLLVSGARPVCHFYLREGIFLSKAAKDAVARTGEVAMPAGLVEERPVAVRGRGDAASGARPHREGAAS